VLDIPYPLFESKYKPIDFNWEIKETLFFVRQSKKTVLQPGQYDPYRAKDEGTVDVLLILFPYVLNFL
jgi:hypothetical protein